MENERSGFERRPRIGQLLCSQIFFPAHQPVISLGKRAAWAVAFMEIVICLKEPTVLLFLIRAADFLADKPAHSPEQPRLALIESNALPQKLDAFHHPRIAIMVVIKLHGDVV